MGYDGLLVEREDHVAWVYLNRPEKRNALEPDFWAACVETFQKLDRDRDVRVIVVAGKGKAFCSGLDLTATASIPVLDLADQTAANRVDFAAFVRDWQESFTWIERCRKPVIAAVHGACVGGGLDLIAACDIRIASADAYFSLREVAMAMTADLGSLQRLPLIIGHGLTRELAFTARDVKAQEAQEMHLVNRVFADHDALIEGARAMAKQIAEQSPLAVQSSKETLNYARDMSVEEGLHYAALRNSMIMPSPELFEAFQAFMEKRKPKF
ncbi:MAG: crotonase/enoyl-CoA hydratase family protein [Myxococcales bacterium]|nr:crotonase/enoyl-CoA hydratase family protein [Myxococcales bacterium]